MTLLDRLIRAFALAVDAGALDRAEEWAEQAFALAGSGLSWPRGPIDLHTMRARGADDA